MGQCSSVKEDPDDDGPVGGGLDGWSIGRAASMEPSQFNALTRSVHSTTSQRAMKLHGNEVAPQGVKHDDIKLHRDQDLSGAVAGAPSPAAVSAKLRSQSMPPLHVAALAAPIDQPRTPGHRSTDGMHSFPAFVLCNFEAVAPDVPGVPQIELRVTRGEYVTVEIDPDMPPPDGWCLCRVERTGEPRGGPEVAAAVPDARVAVELLEEQVRLAHVVPGLLEGGGV